MNTALSSNDALHGAIAKTQYCPSAAQELPVHRVRALERSISAPSPVITKRELCRLLNKSPAWIYSKLNPHSKYYDPTFPRQIRLTESGTSVMWILSEVLEWLGRQVERSRQPVALSSDNSKTTVE